MSILPAGFVSCYEGQQIVKRPLTTRHSVAAAIPPRPARTCQKRSVDGMEPAASGLSCLSPQGGISLDRQQTNVVGGGVSAREGSATPNAR